MRVALRPHPESAALGEFVLEVELERHGQRWIYEIKLLRPGGALSKLLVDARDGTVIANREHGAKR